MREAFKEHKFNWKSLVTIDQANDILAEYAGMGFPAMTVRQIYYQMVARDMIENTLQSYKRIVSLLTNARESGLVDWESIEDRTRRMVNRYYLDDLKDAVSDAKRTYLNNLWENQPWFVLVMVEKEALAGVIDDICTRLYIPWTANRGYPSESHAYRMGKRLASEAASGKKVLVLHLGDLDPSGWDMTRDIAAKMARFGDSTIDLAPFERDDWKSKDEDDYFMDMGANEIEVQRVALNKDQIEQYKPPPNPAKSTDSRHGFYTSRFGSQSWELDALAPPVLRSLIEEAVDAVKDQDLWDEDMKSQETDREALEGLTRLDEDTIRHLGNLAQDSDSFVMELETLIESYQ